MPGTHAGLTGAAAPTIVLQENGPARTAELTPTQVAALGASGLVTVAPGYAPGEWLVGPGDHVGAARVGGRDGVEVRIAPKLPIRRLLFLLGYAGDVSGWRDGAIDVAPDTDLLVAMATAFARSATRATDQGLLQGYRVVEDSAPVLRGRLRADEQLRRRFGMPIPLEVRYDEYGVDTPENRILRTATERLLRLPGVPQQTRRTLLRLVRLMADIPALPRGHQIPAWRPTRLNARYVPALRLGDLILRGGSIDTEHGRLAVDGFVLDLPRVFENFLTTALRDALAHRGGRLVGQDSCRLDDERQITIRPDIVWYPAGHEAPGAVADAKYKAEKHGRYGNADVYQLLTYCLRLGLSEGHLVYAKGGGEPSRHHIVGTDITIVRHALDLAAEPQELLTQVAELASAVATTVGDSEFVPMS